MPNICQSPLNDVDPSVSMEMKERRKHNASLSIHTKLPPEILIMIFRLLHPTEFFDVRYMHVCSYWRDLIRHTPEFYTYVLALGRPGLEDCEDVDQYLATHLHFIQRSSPLCFHLDIGQRLDTITTGVAAPYTHRLRSLAICPPDDYLEFIVSFLALDIPTLVHLRLEHLYSMESDSQAYKDAARKVLVALPPARINKFPNLRGLETHGCYFIPALAFPTLKNIHVGAPFLSPNAFILAFSRCTALETITINNEDADIWGNIFHSSWGLQPFVTLPKLRLLKLSVSSSNDVSIVLNRLRGPPTVALELFAWSGSFSSALSYALLQDFIGTIADLTVSSVPDARPSYGTLSVHGRDAHGALRLSFNIVHSYAFYPQDVAHVFQSHGNAVTALHVHAEYVTSGQDEEIDAAAWRTLLGPFAALMVLDVRVHACEELARALAANHGTEEGLVCPQLRVLKIASRSGVDAPVILARVLGSRADCGGAERLRLLVHTGLIWGVGGPPEAKSHCQESQAEIERLKDLVDEVVFE